MEKKTVKENNALKEELLKIKEDTLTIKEAVIEKIKIAITQDNESKEKETETLLKKIKALQNLLESTYGGEMFLVERYNVPKVFTDEIDEGRIKEKLFELIKQL